MYQSNIKTSGHVWKKQNLVTVNRAGKMFDEMVCVNCKMKGRRFGFTSVEVAETYKFENVHLCPKAEPVEAPKRIKVTKCSAYGAIFANLLPNTEHDIVEPPDGYQNDRNGVWVMGVGEPVKLLNGEFTVCS